ncbi:hypothetical protein GSI_04148 [Ganoderma sinense ZZ0214-1]|uniref:Uncharacterized protein n=1 Tax=Ganoderma sinense ZZ0214-1 TaxID=1077348 RepID=A0A2G8SIC0_9APHY|nr:hypothetical protein GSI_04148 [Ganoderma sinense ZZ0214-1]
MSANSIHPFPAPVGGVPDALDFAPPRSSSLSCMHRLMAPIVIWRMAHPGRSHNTIILTTSLFSTERGGFNSIEHDVVNVLRALLVVSTLGGHVLAHHKLTPPHVRKAQKQTQEAGSCTALTPRATAGGEGEGEGMYEVELDVDRDGASSSSRTYEGGPDVEFADTRSTTFQIRVRESSNCDAPKI